MTTHKLRYTGAARVTFRTGNVGVLEPGAEFTVAEELLPRFEPRADVEHSAQCPCGARAASEDASASQDGETSGGSPSGKRGRSGSPSGKNGTGGQ